MNNNNPEGESFLGFAACLYLALLNIENGKEPGGNAILARRCIAQIRDTNPALAEELNFILEYNLTHFQSQADSTVFLNEFTSSLRRIQFEFKEGRSPSSSVVLAHRAIDRIRPMNHVLADGLLKILNNEIANPPERVPAPAYFEIDTRTQNWRASPRTISLGHWYARGKLIPIVFLIGLGFIGTNVWWGYLVGLFLWGIGLVLIFGK